MTRQEIRFIRKVDDLCVTEEPFQAALRIFLKVLCQSSLPQLMWYVYACNSMAIATQNFLSHTPYKTWTKISWDRELETNPYAVSALQERGLADHQRTHLLTEEPKQRSLHGTRSFLRRRTDRGGWKGCNSLFPPTWRCSIRIRPPVKQRCTPVCAATRSEIGWIALGFDTPLVSPESG